MFPASSCFDSARSLALLFHLGTGFFALLYFLLSPSLFLGSGLFTPLDLLLVPLCCPLVFLFRNDTGFFTLLSHLGAASSAFLFRLGAAFSALLCLLLSPSLDLATERFTLSP